MTSIYDLSRSCKPDEKNYCPVMPHYTMPISDQDFVNRNIELSNQGGSMDMMDTLNQYTYPGDLAHDEARTMKKDEYEEWTRQEDVARRNTYPSKYWQDLNRGRHYARGLDDTLDLTNNERNNWASGWINGMSGAAPGSRAYRDPYEENHTAQDPMNYRRPFVSNATMGSRHYFYSIYDLDRYPDMHSKCERTLRMRSEGGEYKKSINYPERYN